MGRFIGVVLALVGCLSAWGSGFEVRDSVLVIPSGTLKIAAKAFADRTDFNSVRFESPCRVADIGDYAFLGCANLREIALPPSVTHLGQGTFRECSSLQRVSLPTALTVIPRYAFAWCSSLESVDPSPRLADIQAHAFAYCSSLQAFDFGKVLTHVGSNAFSFCSSLRSVTLPATVKELESYAFAECAALTTAVMPANSHLLGELIFSGCRAMESITILSPVPPKFDCASTLFEATEPQLYDQCILHVPAAKVAAYRAAPAWSLFRTIESANP